MSDKENIPCLTCVLLAVCMNKVKTELIEGLQERFSMVRLGEEWEWIGSIEDYKESSVEFLAVDCRIIDNLIHNLRRVETVVDGKINYDYKIINEDKVQALKSFYYDECNVDKDIDYEKHEKEMNDE